MSSIDDHVKTIKSKLENNNISTEFINEFLENYADQLISMKEDLVNNKNFTKDKAEDQVLKQVEPVPEIIKHVINLYDEQDISGSKENSNIFPQDSIPTIILFLRLILVLNLFLLYTNVRRTRWLDFKIFRPMLIDLSESYYDHIILLYILFFILILDAWIIKKAENNKYKDYKRKFLLSPSVSLSYYLISLILILTPKSAPYAFVTTDDSLIWTLNFAIFILVIFTVSTIEWIRTFEGELNFNRLLKKINPLTLILSYCSLIIIFHILISIINDIYFGNINLPIIYEIIHDGLQREIEYSSDVYIFTFASLSLLFTIIQVEFWKKNSCKETISLKSFLKISGIWLSLNLLLSTVFIFQNEINNIFFPSFLFYDEFIQSVFAILFFLLIILILTKIPQLSNNYLKLWFIFCLGIYTIAIANYFNFHLALEEFGGNLDNYKMYYWNTKEIIIPLSILILISLTILILVQKYYAKNHSINLQFYIWSTRALLFLLLYEFGFIAAIFYDLDYLFLPINQKCIFVFFLFEIIMELIFYFTSKHELFFVKIANSVIANINLKFSFLSKFKN